MSVEVAEGVEDQPWDCEAGEGAEGDQGGEDDDDTHRPAHSRLHDTDGSFAPHSSQVM